MLWGPTPPARTAETTAGIGLQLIAEGFTSPVNLVPLGDDSGRLLISDQVGTIHLLNKDGKLSEQLVLDLRGRMTQLNQGFDERGLLGLALHPKFKENRKLYLFYSAPLRPTAPTNFNCTSRVSEFQMMREDYARVQPDSERVLLEIDKPQMNHNCGRLLFGPDGYLYIGTGDGGGANDGGGAAENALGHAPQGNGQDTTTLLGKILRIDVDNGRPYAIPPDNPFAKGKQGRPEIYAYGLRNPWGLSFDRGGIHELFAADVGQNLFEELDIIVKGGNYGWRVREGLHGFDPKNPNEAPAENPTIDAGGRPLIDPVAEYRHPPRNKVDPAQVQGISITGGYVYRGQALAGLQGKYIFADWSRTWALPDGVLFVASRSRPSQDQSQSREARWNVEYLPLASPAKGRIGAYIVALGEDEAGELYVLTNGRNSLTGQTGKVFKLIPL